MPGEEAVKIVDMTTKNLEYHIHLAGKTVAGFERIDSNFESSSTEGKMLSKSTACNREIIHEESQTMQQTSWLSYFRKLPQPPQP